jgi:hypothetical protein
MGRRGESFQWRLGRHSASDSPGTAQAGTERPVQGRPRSQAPGARANSRPRRSPHDGGILTPHPGGVKPGRLSESDSPRKVESNISVGTAGLAQAPRSPFVNAPRPLSAACPVSRRQGDVGRVPQANPPPLASFGSHPPRLGYRASRQASIASRALRLPSFGAHPPQGSQQSPLQSFASPPSPSSPPH